MTLCKVQNLLLDFLQINNFLVWQGLETEQEIGGFLKHFLMIKKII